MALSNDFSVIWTGRVSCWISHIRLVTSSKIWLSVAIQSLASTISKIGVVMVSVMGLVLMRILLIDFELNTLKMGGVVSLSALLATALHIRLLAYFVISTTP